ncbi:unnamed protein product [Nezara viridula]|uniref:Aspartate/glutamate/uridylate kinase domain-containing protein n=1 Tax=Nezara viridula TaxID=85310 RepID=A0A9P0HAL9_NEZVI|nr:unnamed protein product [Nezara viridula]
MQGNPLFTTTTNRLEIQGSLIAELILTVYRPQLSAFLNFTTVEIGVGLSYTIIALKDNDSLAAMLAAEVEADLLILMSDVDGIYTKPPSQEGARLIPTFTPDMMKTITFGYTLIIICEAGKLNEILCRNENNFVEVGLRLGLLLSPGLSADDFITSS